LISRLVPRLATWNPAGLTRCISSVLAAGLTTQPLIQTRNKIDLPSRFVKAFSSYVINNCFLPASRASTTL
jgi:hypothetical protein